MDAATTAHKCPVCQAKSVSTRAACGRIIQARCLLCKGFSPERADVLALQDETTKAIAWRTADALAYGEDLSGNVCQKADIKLLGRIEKWLKAA